MKITFNKPRLTFLSLLFIGLTAIVATSCNKNSGNSSDEPVAHVMIANSVQGSASQYLYLNGAKLNASAVAYAQTSTYLSALSGTDNAEFISSGSTTANTTFSLNLQPNAYYTVYFTGTDTTQTSFTTQDDLTLPPSGQAKVQFINLSTAVTSAVDFGVTGSAKLVTSLGNRVASAYYNVNANTTFSLYAAGSLTAMLSIPASIQAGKIYTVYITGTSAINLSYHVVAHN